MSTAMSFRMGFTFVRCIFQVHAAALSLIWSPDKTPDLPGWDVFILKYDVEEPIATVLDSASMKAYLQIFRLLWALKRAEHSLNDCWVDLNSLQRQLSAFPRYVRESGLQSYSEPFLLCSLSAKDRAEQHPMSSEQVCSFMSRSGMVSCP